MNAGEVSGNVKDQLGGLIPGSIILAEQMETGQKFTTTTNSSGAYVLPLLPVGSYSVRASARDFKQSVLPNFEIHVGDKLQYDFTLQIGNATESVKVEVDAGGAQLESADIKDLVQNRGDAMQRAGTLVNVLGQRSGHNLYLMDGI
jgi:hypothetical protein